MIFFILFIFGLAIGSFLNVVSLRYDPDSGRSIFSLKPIGGRSHCPHCRRILRWYDLVPVLSFLFLRGQCRECGGKISWQYPIVELLSGAIALTPLYFFNHYGLGALASAGEAIFPYWTLALVWTLAFYIFLLIALVDLKWTIIPDELNIALAVLGAIKVGALAFYHQFNLTLGTFLGGYGAIFGWRGNIYLNHLIALFFALAFFGAIILVTRGRGMGMGDLKLSAALGLLLGYPDIIVSTFLAFILGSVYSLLKMATAGLKLKDAVPFGPFIVLGAVVVVFYGADILRVYFTFFG